MDQQGGGEIQQATAEAAAVVESEERLFEDDNFGNVRTDLSINDSTSSKTEVKTSLQESLLSNQERFDAPFDGPGETEFLDPEKEAKRQQKIQLKKKMSLFLLYFINIVLFIEVSIFVPTVNELVRALLPEEYADWSALVIGAALSCYSLTQTLFTPLISWLCAKTRYRIIFFFCVILTLIGNLIYALSINIWVLIIGRLIAGIGAGNVGASFTYVRMCTTAKERTKEFVNLRLAMAIGMVFGPACSFLITLIWEFTLRRPHQIDIIRYGPFVLSEGTAAAWASVVFLAGLALITLLLLGEPVGGEDISHAEKAKLRPSLIIPLFINFVVTFIIMCFQTIITVITNEDYTWGGWENSLLFLGVSFYSLPVIFVLKFMSKFLNERLHTIIGLFILFCGLLFDLIDAAPMSIFFTGIVVFMTGYTIAVTLVPGVYSSLIPPRETAVAMSYLASAASAARVIGPFTGGAIHAFFEVIQSWLESFVHINVDSETPVILLMLISVAVSLLLLTFFYKQLRPYQPNTKKIRGGGPEDPGMPLQNHAEDQSDSMVYLEQKE